MLSVYYLPFSGTPPFLFALHTQEHCLLNCTAHLRRFSHGQDSKGGRGEGVKAPPIHPNLLVSGVQVPVLFGDPCNSNFKTPLNLLPCFVLRDHSGNHRQGVKLGDGSSLINKAGGVGSNTFSGRLRTSAQLHKAAGQSPCGPEPHWALSPVHTHTQACPGLSMFFRMSHSGASHVRPWAASRAVLTLYLDLQAESHLLLPERTHSELRLRMKGHPAFQGPAKEAGSLAAPSGEGCHPILRVLGVTCGDLS